MTHLDELYATAEEHRKRRDQAETAMLIADQDGDVPLYEAAALAFHAADDALHNVLNEIEAAEDDEALANLRQDRADYWRSVL